MGKAAKEEVVGGYLRTRDAQLLEYGENPAGGNHDQSGSANYLLRALRLRRAYINNGAPGLWWSPVVSNKPGRGIKGRV